MYIAIPHALWEKRTISTKEEDFKECFQNNPLIDHLGDVLGSGSFGTTYEACPDKGACRLVAKIVPILKQTAIREFQLEAYMSQYASKHGFGPKIHGVIWCAHKPKGVGDRVIHALQKLLKRSPLLGYGIIVMDRLTGTLASLGTVTKADLESLMKIVKRMHQANFFHGDLHNHNIMYVAKKGGQGRRFYIIDFGFSWILRKPSKSDQRSWQILKGADLMWWFLFLPDHLPLDEVLHNYLGPSFWKRFLNRFEYTVLMEAVHLRNKQWASLFELPIMDRYHRLFGEDPKELRKLMRSK
jgi:serine/threonine protein kinase